MATTLVPEEEVAEADAVPLAAGPFEDIFPSFECLSSIGNNDEVECPVESCKKSYRHRGLLKMHLVRYHKIVTNENDRLLSAGKGAKLKNKNVVKRFFCPVEGCRNHVDPSGQGKPFASLFLLKKHFLRMHGEKNFACECGVQFAIKSDCTRHAKLCDAGEACTGCGVRYKNLCSLRGHMKSCLKPQESTEKLDEKDKETIPTTVIIISGNKITATTDKAEVYRILYDTNDNLDKTRVEPEVVSPPIKKRTKNIAPRITFSQSPSQNLFVPVMLTPNSVRPTSSFSNHNLSLPMNTDPRQSLPIVLLPSSNVTPLPLAISGSIPPVLSAGPLPTSGNLLIRPIPGPVANHPLTFPTISLSSNAHIINSGHDVGASCLYSNNPFVKKITPASFLTSANSGNGVQETPMDNPNSPKRKSSAETQTSKDLTIEGSLMLEIPPQRPLPYYSATNAAISGSQRGISVGKQSRAAQVSPRSKVSTKKGLLATRKEKKHNETQTKTMTIKKLSVPRSSTRESSPKGRSTNAWTSPSPIESQQQQQQQRRLKVAASRGTHADMRTLHRSKKIPAPLSFIDATVLADSLVENPTVDHTPPRTMVSMLKELDSIFESISTQTQESFLLDKSKEAKTVAFEPQVDQVLTGRDVSLGCGEEGEEEEGDTVKSAPIKKQPVKATPPVVVNSFVENSLVDDTAPIFEICDNAEINACAQQHLQQRRQQQQHCGSVLPVSNSYHMETQTDISSQVLEGLWSLSGFPTGQDQQQQQEYQHQTSLHPQPSTMTHIETQTQDSEPVGFCENFFSHMETQTTEDLFPDLMDCLASVDAESMADVIQCHDLNAPHVLRIFCDDSDVAATSVYAAASRDATTNASLHSDAKNDRCVQTHRESSAGDANDIMSCKTTTASMPTTTNGSENESGSDTEEELRAAVSSLMDSQTQTYFHQMDLS